MNKTINKTIKNEVYVTRNYDLFKRLAGNRPVKNGRVVKIIESIEKYGWLSNPILVNEHYEIIDGQGRFEALKRLGMPIEYIVHDGIGLIECQGLNNYQKNWTLMDHINSFVENKNENYIFLKHMLVTYNTIPKHVVISVVATKGVRYGVATGGHYETISGGHLILTRIDKVNIENALFYLSRFSDTAKHLGGRKDKFYSALMFLYLLDGIDKERVCKCINNARYDKMVASATLEGYLQQFEDIYNKSLAKKNRVDIMHEYKIA